MCSLPARRSAIPMPLKNWKEALDGIEYDPTVVEITTDGIAEQILVAQGWNDPLRTR